MLRRLLRASTLLLLPSALFAQGKFEGVISIKMSGSQQGPNEVQYMVKGDKMRMEMAGMGGMSMYMLRDGTTNTGTVVIPSQKMYMEMNGNPAAQAMADHKMPDIKMTGRKETIAGYECEHVLITGDDGKQFDVCATKALGSFKLASNPMGRGRGAMGTQVWERIGSDFFPLRVQQVGGDVALEVTKIEKKPIDASMFAVPDDYRKMDMGMGRMGRPPRN